MSHSPIDIWFGAIALGCAALACTHDLRTRRIPNWLTGPAALTALLGHLAVSGWASLASAAAAALIAGIAMLAFFLAGGLGAGDVKLMAAVACFTGLHSLGVLLLATSLAGALLAVAIAWRQGALRLTITNCVRLAQHHHTNGLVPHAEHNVHSGTGLRIPFTLPIAAGCTCTLLLQLAANGR